MLRWRTSGNGSGGPGTFSPLTATGLFTQAAEDSITAHAGGGKASATALSATKNLHRIATCATAADSVLMPSALAGQAHFLKNNGVAACQVFGAGTDTIDGVATGTGISLEVSGGIWLCCETAGNWTTSFLASAPPIIGGTTPAPINGTTGVFTGALSGLNLEVFKTATADSPLTAAQCAGTIVSNFGMTDADCTIALPTAVAGYSFTAILPAVRARFFKFQAGSSDKIYLVATAGSDNGSVGVASGYATGASCNFFTFKASDGGYDWFALPISGTWIAS